MRVGSRTCPGVGPSARVAPQQSPILSADDPHGERMIAIVKRTNAQHGLSPSNSRSIARYSLTNATLQLSVKAVFSADIPSPRQCRTRSN